MPVVKLVTPGQTLEVNPGDTIRVKVAFTYQGPAWRETLYTALLDASNDELSGGAGSKGWDIPKCDNPTSITNLYVDILSVPNRPGTWGIYAKLGNILSTIYRSVIKIVGIPIEPIVTNFRITDYSKV